MAKFIMFDLDGTLIDGVDDLLFAMNELLGVHDLAPLKRHDLEAMLGDGTWMLTKRAFAARGETPDDATLDELNIDFNARYRATDYAHTRLYDNAEATLRNLAKDGWTIALASNKPTAPCERILEKLGISDLFAVIAGGDATTVKKPDSGHLRFVLGKLGYNAANGDIAVMVGDHANDINAARDAGTHAIAVAFEVSADRANTLNADAVVTDYTNLVRAINDIIQPKG
ncbi:HAD-IA family hydrolase [Thalassospira lucentensis]|uniref:phosphoglycolate phosphatase n=1 Tax=Thalassospira lucentensis TaxID=168935 RepID=A0A358HNG9_9PROT|nr:HAD-IA family hydrolase [Thalassospira lucentensis]HBU96728.1 phosphoglycolate phosphatase [Thalassospira lucentensis]HCW68530.1 phosphoglycolate phosphatase [Thalassospira lucentensis]